MPTYSVPDHVQANAAQRAAVRNRARIAQCAGEAGRCRRPGKHACARFGGTWCDEHWAQLPRTTAEPRTEEQP